MKFNNKFVHKNNLIMKREDAFRLTQEQVSKNIEFVLKGLIGDSYGVFSSGLDDDKLKVVRSGGSIVVNPGQAITPSTDSEERSIVYLGGDTAIPVTIPDGLGDSYCINAYAKTSRSLSGKENYLPGKAGVFGLLTIEDSSINVMAEANPAGINLAKVTGNKPKVTGTFEGLPARPYIDKDDMGWREVILSGTIFSNGDDSTYIIKIKNEYVKCSLVTLSSIMITERGLYGTQAVPHFKGEPIELSSIIDMRANNMISLGVSEDVFISNLRNGVIDFEDGSGERLIVSKKIPDIPNTPTLSGSDIELLWLNKQATGGYINPSIIDTIDDVKTNTEKVESLQSDILELRARSLNSADDDDLVDIQAQLLDKQAEMAERSVSIHEATKMISQVSKRTSKTKRKYVARVIVSEPELIDGEAIVRYEASVIYSSVSRRLDDSGTPSYVHSRTLTPSGIGIHGEYTYGSATADDRSIYIPIKEGEKISVKVRAISEGGFASAWSDEEKYEFNGSDDTEIAMAEKIEEILTEKTPYEKGIITKETIALIQNAIESVNALSVQVANNASMIQELKQIIGNIKVDTAVIVPIDNGEQQETR